MLLSEVGFYFVYVVFASFTLRILRNQGKPAGNGHLTVKEKLGGAEGKKLRKVLSIILVFNILIAMSQSWALSSFHYIFFSSLLHCYPVSMVLNIVSLLMALTFLFPPWSDLHIPLCNCLLDIPAWMSQIISKSTHPKLSSQSCPILPLPFRYQT